MNADPVMRMVERLPRAEPDSARAARTRARCRAALARRRRERAPVRFWESALVGGLCAAYFVEVVRQALHLYGVL